MATSVKTGCFCSPFYIIKGKDQNMVEYFRVGVITNSHGVRGEVKVYPTTEDINRFKKLKKVFLDNKGTYQELNIIGVKFVKNMVVLKFAEYDNINDILQFKNMDLYVDREHAIPLNEGEFYIADMIGADVVTDTDEHLGTLKDIMKTGANNVYIVNGDNGKDILLPDIDECILSKDVENKLIKVHIMKGLIV